MNFYEQYRHGSASWSSVEDIQQAGLLNQSGPLVGFLDENQSLHDDTQGPIILFGGARSGKLRDLLSYTICCYPGPMMVNDLKGELAAISYWHQHKTGKHAYLINPSRMHGLPHHRCNPWDHLITGSTSLSTDIKLAWDDILPLSGSADGKFFELNGRRIGEEFTHFCVEHHGHVHLPMIYDIVNRIEANPDWWQNFVQGMLRSKRAEVRSVGAEMWERQQKSPKQFASFLSELRIALDFLSDPSVYETAKGGDFSLSALTDPDQPASVYVITPAENVEIWSKWQRALFGQAMLYKQRAPLSPSVLFIFDEAGQMGKFDAMLRAVTYGPGAGVRAMSIWQDFGQIAENYGDNAIRSFIGSSHIRMFIGTRDYQTARDISDMLGDQTLQYDEPMQKYHAHNARRETIMSIVNGEDPIDSSIGMAHQARHAALYSKMPRSLLKPDEILRLSDDQFILQVTGRPPILAKKYPYYEQKYMAGWFHPNPFHPPADRVFVGKGRRKRALRIRVGDVPRRLQAFPQFREGVYSYVKGYA